MFRGRVYKDGKFWLIEVPVLDLMTQGHTREDAYEMLVDLFRTARDRPSFQADIVRLKNNAFLVGGRDEESERDMIALLLRGQRMKAGLSLSDMARLLNAKSKNSYARYEQGVAVPSPLMMARILQAMGLNFEMRVSSTSDDDEITAA